MIIDATNVKKETLERVGLYSEKNDMRVLIINASDDRAGERYISTKQKACEGLNIECDVKHFDETVTMEELREYILKKNDEYDGIMIQDPVYKHLNHATLMGYIQPTKDIDGLHPVNQGLLYDDPSKGVRPCTALGVMSILTDKNIELEGKNVVIVGRGKLVADPLAKMMEYCGATVTKIHTKTHPSYARNHIYKANIIVSCVGKDMSYLINPRSTSRLEALIGVGFRYSDEGKQIQDFDIHDSWNKNIDITDNVRATGLATVMALMDNIVLCHETHRKKYAK